MTDTARVQVQPAPRRRVRNPATGEPLPAKATGVAWSPFWNRRLEAGDIVLVTPKGSKK